MFVTLTCNPAVDYHMNPPRFPSEPTTYRSAHESFRVGGKGITVSRVLHNLGAETVAWGFAGGFTGDYIRNCLDKEGVSQDFISLPDQLTRINIKIKAGEEEGELNASGPFVSEADLQALYEKVSRLTREDVFICSGSPARMEPREEPFYLSLAKRLSENGVPFVFDFSGRDLFSILPYRPFLIKPNRLELSQLFPVPDTASPAELASMADQLCSMGAQNVIVSLGDKGALYSNGRSRFYCPGFRPGHYAFHDAVGAGDSMIAGFLYAFKNKNHGEKEAFATAVASATATVYSEGLATREMTEEFFEQILPTVETLPVHCFRE